MVSVLRQLVISAEGAVCPAGEIRDQINTHHKCSHPLIGTVSMGHQHQWEAFYCTFFSLIFLRNSVHNIHKFQVVFCEMIVLDTSSVFREITKDSLNMNPKLFQDENLVFNIVYFNDLTKNIHEVTICRKM